jgi:hypothetical protein
LKLFSKVFEKAHLFYFARNVLIQEFLISEFEITSPAGSLHPLDHFTRWIITRWITSPAITSPAGTSPAGSLHPPDHFTRWITSPAGSLHPLDHFTRWITSPAGSLHPLDHPQSQAEPTIIGFYTSIPAIPAIQAIRGDNDSGPVSGILQSPHNAPEAWRVGDIPSLDAQAQFQNRGPACLFQRWHGDHGLSVFYAAHACDLPPIAVDDLVRRC